MEVDIFNENAVIIFVTLLKPLGYVKRTTSSFTKIFQYPSEHVINNSCNIIMPTHIGLIHDRFLEQFLQSDRMKSLEKGEILNFGKR
jgi:hypothetical protein